MSPLKPIFILLQLSKLNLCKRDLFQLLPEALNFNNLSDFSMQ